MTRDNTTLDYLDLIGREGVTFPELAAALGLEHGAASASLSRLHAAGKIVRLAETRGANRVYVTPDNAEGRPKAPRRIRPNRTCPHCGKSLT